MKGMLLQGMYYTQLRKSCHNLGACSMLLTFAMSYSHAPVTAFFMATNRVGCTIFTSLTNFD